MTEGGGWPLAPAAGSHAGQGRLALLAGAPVPHPVGPAGQLTAKRGASGSVGAARWVGSGHRGHGIGLGLSGLSTEAVQCISYPLRVSIPIGDVTS